MADTESVPDRHTTNVSLPNAQERFIREQVASGRYRSASEVVRAGLRMLEQAEHARLLEQWLYKGLTDEERASLPPELMERARAHLMRLLEEGEESARREGWIQSDDALRRLADRAEARRRKRPA